MRVLRNILGALLLALCGAGAAVPLEPRDDPYLTHPAVAALMEWVTLQLSFDGDSLVPDMAAGDPTATVTGTPRFEDGLVGRALVCGGDSGAGIYRRAGNAPLESRGAVSMWLKPLDWSHVNGPNTVFVMTTNASFYVERQGPAHNAEGIVTRQEGLLYLLRAKSTEGVTLQADTAQWPPDEWRLFVANWSWPTMSWSVNGGPFQGGGTTTAPKPEEFGDLLVGATGGEPALLDEVTVYRRPLNQDEAKALYDAFRPRQEEAQ